MSSIRDIFDRIDTAITGWMARHAVTVLRLAVGIIFLWFGLLKFVPGLSPAEELSTRTIAVVSFGLIEADLARVILATWESVVGLGLITAVFLRGTLLLLFLQMLGTITPIFLFPGDVFTVFPIGLTLEGQYIVKNMVLIGAALVIGATVRGGGLVDDPRLKQRDGNSLTAAGVVEESRG